VSLLPKYKLPEMTDRDALVLASGPSFGDFDADELQNCPGTLYGCGHVSLALTLDHYVVGDFGQHREQVPLKPETTLWTNEGNRNEMLARSFPCESLQIVPCGTHSASSGNMTLSLACQRGHERVFVLGFDGYSDSYGMHRFQFHALPLDRTPPLYSKCRGKFHINDDDLTQIHVATILQREYGNLWNLTPHCVLPLPAHPDVLSQPLAHLDRHGKLVILIPPEGTTIYCVTELCRYWRHCHPRLPIELVYGDRVNSNAIPDLILRPEMPGDEELAEFNSIDVVTMW